MEIVNLLKDTLLILITFPVSIYNSVKGWFLNRKWNNISFFYFFFSVWFILLSFAILPYFEHNISTLNQFFQTHSFQERDRQSEVPIVYEISTTLQNYITSSSHVLILFPVLKNTRILKDDTGYYYYIVYRLNYRMYPNRLNFGAFDNHKNLILFTYGKPNPKIRNLLLNPNIENFDYILCVSSSLPISNDMFNIISQSSDFCLYRKNR